MTKEKLMKLLEKESYSYRFIEEFNQVVITLQDGTRGILTFMDPKKPEPETISHEELSEFNKNLVRALNYNPKNKKEK